MLAVEEERIWKVVVRRPRVVEDPDLRAELARLRWYLSKRLAPGQEFITLLDEYDSLNPEWMDGMMYGVSGEMPAVYKQEWFIDEPCTCEKCTEIGYRGGEF